MPDEKRPFRLEDEDEPPPRPATPPLPETGEREAADQEARPRRGPAAGARARSPRPGEDPQAAEVDERTVAERQGRAIDPVATRRPPPPGWPAEALGFPLRGVGPAHVVLLAVVWAALDLVGWWNVFVGWLLKLSLLPFHVRWQLHVAGMAAAGHDAPASWGTAMALDREDLGRLGRLLVVALLLFTPGLVALLTGSPLVAILLLGLASAWLTVATLGTAVADPGLALPWRAVPWLSGRPLACLGGAVGWWLLVLAEIGAGALAEAPALVVAVAALALRLVALYAWLLGARAIGVLGRAWTPEAEGPLEEEDEGPAEEA